MKNQGSFKRGAKFVLGLGTKIIKDKKKEWSKKFCRDKDSN
jgi:hypothetical protein